MIANTYQPPANEHAVDYSDLHEPNPWPPALIGLIALMFLHLIVNFAITALGMIGDNPFALVGGGISIVMYCLMIVGILRHQEWARITTIWMSYVGLFASLFILFPLEVPTLICAHWPSVRRVTKKASMAEEYIYRESSETV